MASEEHKVLAQYLKNVHSSLRNATAAKGVNKAWQDHCNNKDVLKKYAKYMQQLATIHWEKNSSDKLSLATSRIKWSANFSFDYFENNTIEKFNVKELEIALKINITLNNKDIFTKPYKLLDVGSCYNPFKDYEFLDVLAIDLCPANEYVMECDFVNVTIGTETHILDSRVEQLQENNFDIVTFCFLLEYIPTSELRITACENAYKLLKLGGLLIITTPDSKHVGANSKIMKSWRYALAMLGFSRIKYEKLRHMHCIVLRKSLHKDIAVRWATLHKEPYMDGSIHIPQDSSCADQDIVEDIEIEAAPKDFTEQTFSDLNSLK